MNVGCSKIGGKIVGVLCHSSRGRWRVRLGREKGVAKEREAGRCRGIFWALGKYEDGELRSSTNGTKQAEIEEMMPEKQHRNQGRNRMTEEKYAKEHSHSFLHPPHDVGVFKW